MITKIHIYLDNRHQYVKPLAIVRFAGKL